MGLVPDLTLGLSLLITSIGVAAPTPPPATLGFRHDGTGRFPNATPPTHWSLTKNVRWRTPLPARGNASPVLVGRKLFVTAEPNLLLCIDAETGHELWRRESRYVDTLSGAEQQRAVTRLVELEKLDAELSEGLKELEALKKTARKKGAPPEMKARITALSERTNALAVKLAEDRVLRPSPVEYVIGWASSTPVTDGKALFILFGDGVLASFDLEGNRRWIRWLGETPTNMKGYDRGSAASLLLADGVLVVPYRALTGIDPSTGKELWRGPEYVHFGTPAVAHMPSGAVVATPGGELVRAKDGRPITKVPHLLWYIGPIVEKDALYFAGAETPYFSAGLTQPIGAFRLSPDGTPTPLWESTLPTDRFYATPVFDRDLVYLVSEGGELMVLDAATGRLGHREKIDALGTVFASPVIAGDNLYVSFDHSGQMFVFRRGPKPTLIAKNSFEPLLATPVFSGRRMYVRTSQALYCIEQR